MRFERISRNRLRLRWGVMQYFGLTGQGLNTGSSTPAMRRKPATLRLLQLIAHHSTARFTMAEPRASTAARIGLSWENPHRRDFNWG